MLLALLESRGSPSEPVTPGTANCCCDCKCKIYEDKFNREDGPDNVGGQWSKDSGDWEILDSELSIHNSNAQLRLLAPLYEGASKVTVEIKGAAGDEIDLIIATFSASPTDTYFRLRVTIAEEGSQCGFATLDYVEGASVSHLFYQEIISGLVAGEWHTLSLCWDPNDSDDYSLAQATISATVAPATGITRYFTQETQAGTTTVASPWPYNGEYSIALGTGSISGVVSFDNLCWQHQKTEDEVGCPNCDPPNCTIFTDDFDRDDSTDLGCYWFEINGDWEISTNILTVDSTRALAACTVGHPNRANAYLKILAKFYAGANGDKARIYLPLLQATEVDRGVTGTDPSVWSSDYAVVEFEVGTPCGYMRIFECWVGTETQVGVDVPVLGLLPNQWHNIFACFGDGLYNTLHGSAPTPIILPVGVLPSSYGYYANLLMGGVTTASDQAFYMTRWLPHGSYLASLAAGGLGTGDTLAYPVKFDDFEIQLTHSSVGANPLVRRYANCPSCIEANLECIYATTGRVDPTAADCLWSEIAGVWTKSTNSVSTTSANAYLQHLLEHPFRSTKMRMEGLLLGTTNNDQVVLRICQDDTLNTGSYACLGLRVTIHDTCGLAELIQSTAGGSITVLATLPIEPLATNVYHYFCVQYKDGKLSAEVMPDIWDGGTDSIDFYTNRSDAASKNYRHLSVNATPSNSGSFAGIGSGTVTGQVTVTGYLTFVKDAYFDCFTCNSCSLLFPDKDPATNCEWDPINGTSAVKNLTGIKLSTVGDYVGYKGNYSRPDTSASFTVRSTTDGQRLRVYINDDSSRTGPWAEIEFAAVPAGVTYLRVGQGGTYQESLFPFYTNETYTVQVCMRSNGVLSAAVISAGDPLDSVSYDTGAQYTGNYLVFELFDANGDIYIGDYLVSGQGILSWTPITQSELMVYNQDLQGRGDLTYTCSTCYVICDCCYQSRSPATMLVEIVNAVGFSYTISGCYYPADYSGAYVAEQHTSCLWSYRNPCYFSPLSCGPGGCDNLPTNVRVGVGCKTYWSLGTVYKYKVWMFATAGPADNCNGYWGAVLDEGDMPLPWPTFPTVDPLPESLRLRCLEVSEVRLDPISKLFSDPSTIVDPYGTLCFYWNNGVDTEYTAPPGSYVLVTAL